MTPEAPPKTLCQPCNGIDVVDPGATEIFLKTFDQPIVWADYSTLCPTHLHDVEILGHAHGLGV